MLFHQNLVRSNVDVLRCLVHTAPADEHSVEERLGCLECVMGIDRAFSLACVIEDPKAARAEGKLLQWITVSSCVRLGSNLACSLNVVLDLRFMKMHPRVDDLWDQTIHCFG